MHRLSDSAYVIDLDIDSREGRSSSALVRFEGYDRSKMQPGDVEPVRTSVDGTMVQVMQWGRDNNLPAQRESLLTDNNIVPALMRTKRSMLVGQGIMLYKEIFEEGKRRIEEVEIPAQIAEDLERADIDTYLREAAGELVKHSSLACEMLRARGNQKIAKLKVQRCTRMRMARRTKRGQVDQFVWGNWDGGRSRDRKHEDHKLLTRYDADSERLAERSINWQQDELFTDGYYAVPYWWGDWEWIDLANRIPRFHTNNLTNGFNIRYHIEVPSGYFRKANTIELSDDLAKAAVDAEDKARRDFVEKMNKFFRGVTNAGRVFISEYTIVESMAKEFPGVKIHVLKNDMQDDALLKLFEASNTANISAQAIHPTLAAVETQGKLSSGSEIRNAYLLWLAIHSHDDRRLMLRNINEQGKRNGWNLQEQGFKLGIRDVEIAKLDDSPSGKTERIAGEPSGKTGDAVPAK